MLKRLWRAAVALLASIGFLWVTITTTPLVEWWGRRLGDVWADAKGDTLIVPGGSMLDNGVIGLNSYWRSVYAARAFEADDFRRIVVTGGGPYPVSLAMRQFLIAQGVPAQAIIAETQSGSTRENALFVARMLPPDAGRLVLLTSDYHMYRALRTFRKAGLNVGARPFPDAVKMAQRWEWRWSAFIYLCMETAKIGYYRTRGWI